MLKWSKNIIKGVIKVILLLQTFLPTSGCWITAKLAKQKKFKHIYFEEYDFF